MKQVLFRIPGLGAPVFAFGTVLVLAYSAGMFLAARRSRRERLDPEVVFDLAAWVLIGGLVGARLFFVVEYWGEKVTSAGEALRVWDGGLVLYGFFVWLKASRTEKPDELEAREPAAVG